MLYQHEAEAEDVDYDDDDDGDVDVDEDAGLHYVYNTFLNFILFWPKCIIYVTFVKL